MGVIRLRVALVGAMGLVVALAAGDVFDQRRWELLAVPVVVAVFAAATAARRWPWRVAGFVAALVGSIGLTVSISGGTVDDARASFGAGVQRLLSTDWPSPARPDLLGTTAAAMAVLFALAAELARSRRLHLTPLVPIAVAQTLVIAFSAPLGARLFWLLPLGALAIVFAVLQPGVTLRDRWTTLAGERRLIPVTGVVVGLAALLAIPVALVDRADPRRNDEPARSSSLLDPIEATLALQTIEPPIDLYQIRIDDVADDEAIPSRWRTAALTEYDGRRWAPDVTLRPIGRRLDPEAEATMTGSITFLDDGLQLIPLPGAAVTVDASIETDQSRSLVRLAERPDLGERIQFSARVEPDASLVSPGGIDAREIDETVSSLTELAEAIIAGTADDGVIPPDVLGRLALIETAMREEFVLDPTASGGGLQRALIVRFIRDTRRGNAEQFATAFVLLARSLGVDARVATGFEVDTEAITRSSGGATVDLSSAQAVVWPEVGAGGEWLAFDPVPEEEISDQVPEPPEPQVQTPAAPQPPIAPPPEVSDDPVVTENDDLAADDEALPTVVRVGLQIAAAVGALLIPILLVVGIILGVKWRRRRRVLAGPPITRIRGAWAIATSRLVDAGLSITPADTNGEIAAEGTAYVASAERELHRLASLASAATFGEPARPDLLAEDATSCLGQVETSMGETRNRWQRLRWHLSLRSLRRSTRSPV